MSSGTITLTNNSAVVSGSSTSFSSDLTAGDFIVSVIGGVTYTLPIRTIDSDTQVTLIKAYDGPSMEGAAWSSVPRDTMNSITAQLAAETAKALRGLNYDKANWQAVYSSSGNITVTLPDGSSFTGPSWNSIVNSLADVYSKAETISNTYNDQTLATTSWVSPTPINGWSNNSGAGGRTAYRKMNGLVYIEINLTGGTQTTGTTLFNIPTNLAPSGNRFAASVGLGLNPTVVYVTTLGEVKLASAAGGDTLIANFCFTLN